MSGSTNIALALSPRGGVITVVAFLADGSFHVPAGVTSIDVLSVGGGGGGGQNGNFAAGGGGGGQVLETLAIPVVALENLTVIIGTGGTPNDFNAGSTRLQRAGVDLVLAFPGTPGDPTNGLGGSSGDGIHLGGTRGASFNGGGGAGGSANGSNATAGAGGVGGAGRDMHLSWGTTYGQNGIFGGGGGGSRFGVTGHAANGIGHGANAGGGAFSDFIFGNIPNGDAGIVLIRYTA